MDSLNPDAPRRAHIRPWTPGNGAGGGRPDRRPGPGLPPGGGRGASLPVQGPRAGSRVRMLQVPGRRPQDAPGGAGGLAALPSRRRRGSCRDWAAAGAAGPVHDRLVRHARGAPGWGDRPRSVHHSPGPGATRRPAAGRGRPAGIRSTARDPQRARDTAPAGRLAARPGALLRRGPLHDIRARFTPAPGRCPPAHRGGTSGCLPSVRSFRGAKWTGR